jgi:hypothetical protein
MGRRVTTAALLAALHFATLAARDGQPKPAAWDETTAPQIAIDGPTTAPAGTLVILDASASRADRLAWTLADGPPDCWRSSPDGRTLYAAHPTAGRLVFVLAAATADGLTIETHTVTLDGPGPEPAPSPDPPGPGPSPLPTPAPLPRGRFDLANYCLALCQTLDAADKPLLAQIAANYDNAARRTAAGDAAYKSPDAVRAATAAANRATLGDQRDRLLPLVFQPLAARLLELEKTAGLIGTGDIAAAWREIAAGVRAWSGGI